VNYERVIRGPPLHLEDAADRDFVFRIRAQPVDRLRGESDELSFVQGGGGAGDVGTGRVHLAQRPLPTSAAAVQTQWLLGDDR